MALLRITIFLSFVVVLCGQDDISCETLPSAIHVTKEEFNDSGDLVRRCEGTIGVSKCEGICLSHIRPSIVTPGGFYKDCQCCREEWMRHREILLTECYNSEGTRLYGELGTMVIELKEPEACSCQKCGA